MNHATSLAPAGYPESLLRSLRMHKPSCQAQWASKCSNGRNQKRGPQWACSAFTGCKSQILAQKSLLLADPAFRALWGSASGEVPLVLEREHVLTLYLPVP